jgi:hypothetical protein
MPSKEIAPQSDEELRRFLHSMGPPPLLSTEDPKAFEELFLNIAQSRKNRDLLSLYLVWEIAVDTWINVRYVRHETIAINRWWSTAHNSMLVAKLEMKATYEGMFRKKAEGLSTYPGNATQEAELRRRIDDTIKDIDAISARVPKEADFNQALRDNSGLMHGFDQLRNSANRRRFGNVVLLDKHSDYLDETTQRTEEVVDAEFKEVEAPTEDPSKTETLGPAPVIAASPSVAPTENENSNDVESQNRSEPAQ